jgi:hypothetical protein
MKRRFLPPIGSVEERQSGQVPPGKWTDATGYLTYYSLGVHTGNDWNLNYPNFDADAHSIVYAIGPGVVTYAQRWPNPNAWGEIIVIYHGIVDGKPCYSRSAHVEHRHVSVGQRVDAWTHIADIGNGNGIFAYHLHHDISTTEQLKNFPGDWPGLREDLVRLNYVDPVKWLREEHEVEGDEMPDNLVIKAANGLPLLDELPFPVSTAVVAEERIVIGATAYRRVLVGDRWGYMLESDANGVYLAPPPPPVPIVTMYANVDGLRIRSQPTTSSTILGTLAIGAAVKVQETGIVANTYHWMKLTEREGYVAKELLRTNP